MKPAKAKYTTLHQICNLIPAHLVSRLAKAHGVDKQARSFFPWSHVVAMLHAQIAHSLSLNDIADTLSNHGGSLATIRQATPPSHTPEPHPRAATGCPMPTVSEMPRWPRPFSGTC